MIKITKCNKTNNNSKNDDHEIIWFHLKYNLVNYEYWKLNECADWNITSYDESLYRGQFTSKRSCHIYMGEDLDRFANAFINTKVMREVSRVKKQLRNAKKDVINNYFWDNHVIALQQDIVNRQRSQTKLETSIISIESSLMSQHSKQLEQSSISTKRLQESSPASTSSKKRLINLSSSTSHFKVPSLSEEGSSTRLPSNSLPSTSNPLTETENSPKHATDTSPSSPSGRLLSAPKLNDTPPSLFSPTKSGLLHSPIPIIETNAMSSPPFSEVVETDGIVCDTTKITIATIIKREATNLHDQYKHGNPLSSRQGKIMSNGLSSILNLVDQSYTSQRKLFTSAEWQQVSLWYLTKLQRKI